MNSGYVAGYPGTRVPGYRGRMRWELEFLAATTRGWIQVGIPSSDQKMARNSYLLAGNPSRQPSDS
eukprot:3474104-Rhodomonas_salina.1